MSFGGRVRIARLWAEYESLIGKEIKVAGWAQNFRGKPSSEICFVELNDGSISKTIQVVVGDKINGYAEFAKSIVGASFSFVGTLIKSPAKGQPFELAVNDNAIHSAKVVGQNDATYPL